MEWQALDIEVKITALCGVDGLVSQKGIIKGIDNGMCSLYLPREERMIFIRGVFLEPVVPLQGDKVKIIFGPDREAIGQLLSIDGSDGVVKLDNGEYKMTKIKFLARLK